jgi:hypothetical protein
VIAGIDAARQAGFKRTKLNCVVLKGRNDHELVDLVRFAIDRELDITFIEEMPLGVISEHERGESFCSSDEVRARLAEQFTLVESTESSQGRPVTGAWPKPPTPGSVSFPAQPQLLRHLQPRAPHRRRPPAAVPGQRTFGRPQARAARPPGNPSAWKRPSAIRCTSSPTAITSKSVAMCRSCAS